MGDFRVMGGTRIFLLMLATIVRTVISTGLGSCPIYPQLPNFDIRRLVNKPRHMSMYEGNSSPTAKVVSQRTIYVTKNVLVDCGCNHSLCKRRPEPNSGKMTGTWYEVERSFYLMEIASSCTRLEVALTHRDYLLITVSTINRWTGNPSTSHGLGIPSYNGSSSFRYKLNNRLPYVIGRLLPGAGHYSVLLTDYDQFAIVWSCTNLSIAHSDRMWVLARSRELAAATRAAVYAALARLRLDPDRLLLAKHANCTRPPDPDTDGETGYSALYI